MFRGQDDGQTFIREDLVPSLQSGRLVMMSVVLSSAGRAETLPRSVFIDQEVNRSKAPLSDWAVKKEPIQPLLFYTPPSKQ